MTRLTLFYVIVVIKGVTARNMVENFPQAWLSLFTLSSLTFQTRVVNGACIPLLHRFRLYLYYSLQVVETSHHGMVFVSLVASYK